MCSSALQYDRSEPKWPTQQQSICDQISLKDNSQSYICSVYVYMHAFFFKVKMLAQLHHVYNLRVAQVIL